MAPSTMIATRINRARLRLPLAGFSDVCDAGSGAPTPAEVLGVVSVVMWRSLRGSGVRSSGVRSGGVRSVCGNTAAERLVEVDGGRAPLGSQRRQLLVQL